jgi:hypothetical protein
MSEWGGCESRARNLCAVIHGDGGQHTDAVGLPFSLRDAENAVRRMRRRIDFLEEQLRRIHGVGHDDDGR